MTQVFPGERLGFSSEYKGSFGTYETNGQIFASLCGVKTVEDGAPKHSVKIQAIPEIGSVVLCRVTRINPRFASLDILAVGDSPCKEFTGIIRVQDVRATEKDKVQIYKSFRPGDVVRAQVISLGDSKSFFLSTASNDLGVVLAQSTAGFTMVPISWEQMMCLQTKQTEFRKCAKPQ